jgi:hypothetical protein
MHALAPDADDPSFEVAQRFNASLPFLEDLRDKGRAAAEVWLARSFAKIGEGSSINVAGLFG